VIELGIVPGGYGWVFPKGDHANFGVGGWEHQGPRLRSHLRRFCSEHGVAESALTDVRGYRLPLRRSDSRLVAGRALLVGDAAGLVDPVSGDGMFEAFTSSRLAAEATLELLAGRAPDLEPYQDAVQRALDPLAAASWGAKLAFDRFPRLAYEVARVPLLWRSVDALIRGDLAHPAAEHGARRAPLKALQALARAAGDPGRPYASAASA
jgi:flavin-dependent dehydrogenase